MGSDWPILPKDLFRVFAILTESEAALECAKIFLIEW